MCKLKVGVLISGGGSNLQALIDASKASNFPAKIIHVISNIPNAFGLRRAKQAGIETTLINHKNYNTREAFDSAINQALSKADVDLVCCAGFMRLMTDKLVNNWRDRMINIHPSLLPKYKGLHTHQRAIDAGDQQAGCTVHFIRDKLDEGPLIIQASVPIAKNDTADRLAAKVLVAEHVIYPQALKLIAERRIVIDGTQALIDGKPGPIIHKG